MNAYEAASLVLQVVVLAVVITTVVVYFRQLQTMEHELAVALGTQSRDTHARLLELAIQDPDLLEVWNSTHSDLSPGEMKRHLFVNLALSHLETGFLLGRLDEGQVAAELAEHASNPHYAAFWARTAVHRRAVLGEDTVMHGFYGLCENAFGRSADFAEEAADAAIDA